MKAILVGCGSMAQQWFQMLQERGFDIAACVDTSPGAAAAFGEQNRVAWFEDLPSALSATRAEKPELLVNLTPPDHHFTVIRAALDHNLDVITEKPLTPGIGEASDLVRVARLRGRRLFVMQNRRYEVGFTHLRDQVSRWRGPLYLTCDLVIPWTYGGFRDQMASPLLEDMLIHSLDQARTLVAAPASWVHGTESTIEGSWMQGAATVTATVGFEDGSVFSYRGSWCAAGAQTSWNGSWSVRGRARSIHWDGLDTIELHTSPLDPRGRPVAAATVDVIALTQGKQTGHARCLDAILESRRTGRRSGNSGAENLPSVALVTALRESCRTHTVVPIDPPAVKEPAS